MVISLDKRISILSSHRVQHHIEFNNIKFIIHTTLQRSFPDQGKFSTSLKAIWESMEKPFLALFNFHGYCYKMDSSFLRYDSLSECIVYVTKSVTTKSHFLTLLFRVPNKF